MTSDTLTDTPKNPSAFTMSKEELIQRVDQVIESLQDLELQKEHVVPQDQK